MALPLNIPLALHRSEVFTDLTELFLDFLHALLKYEKLVGFGGFLQFLRDGFP
jgi:hypothetical protein